MSGLDDFDRAQHHRKADKVYDQYLSSTVRFSRDLSNLTRSEQTKVDAPCGLPASHVVAGPGQLVPAISCCEQGPEAEGVCEHLDAKPRD